MDLKAIVFLLGTATISLIGIPFYLRRDQSDISPDVLLHSEYVNYAKIFNKSDGSNLETKLNSFEKSLKRINELNSDVRQLQLNPDGSIRDEPLQWTSGMPKNRGNVLWGLTQFSDLSPEEFQKKYLDPGMLDRILLRQPSLNSNNLRDKTGKIPDRVDWRQRNVVTDVRHQKNCGACWAFSTVQTMESMRAIQGGPLQYLSVQQVIDCAGNGNKGCGGGDTCSAIEWMTSQRITTEDNYPLTLKNENCQLRASLKGVQVRGNYTCNNYENTEEDILWILANHGPVTAAVDATNWQYYVGGVIQWNCDSNNNHAIQIVGYDKTGSPPFYIIRNSWGKEFGDNGYLYVAIGSNLCGIAREVSSFSVTV